jgi:hypothetical protein
VYRVAALCTDRIQGSANCFEIDFAAGCHQAETILHPLGEYKANSRSFYTDAPMARRPTKLEVYDHRVVCPYCHAAVVIRSLMEQIFMARRDCPVCKREMLIKDGRAVKDSKRRSN